MKLDLIVTIPETGRYALIDLKKMRDNFNIAEIKALFIILKRLQSKGVLYLGEKNSEREFIHSMLEDAIAESALLAGMSALPKPQELEPPASLDMQPHV